MRKITLAMLATSLSCGSMIMGASPAQAALMYFSLSAGYSNPTPDAPPFTISNYDLTLYGSFDTDAVTTRTSTVIDGGTTSISSVSVNFINVAGSDTYVNSLRYLDYNLGTPQKIVDLTTGVLSFTTGFAGSVSAKLTFGPDGGYVAWNLYAPGASSDYLLGPTKNSVVLRGASLVAFPLGDAECPACDTDRLGNNYFSGPANSGRFKTDTRIFVPTVVPVPEPASWAMMIGGFGMIGAVMRRRKAVVSFT